MPWTVTTNTVADAIIAKDAVLISIIINNTVIHPLIWPDSNIREAKLHSKENVVSLFRCIIIRSYIFSSEWSVIFSEKWWNSKVSESAPPSAEEIFREPHSAAEKLSVAIRFACFAVCSSLAHVCRLSCFFLTLTYSRDSHQTLRVWSHKQFCDFPPPPTTIFPTTVMASEFVEGWLLLDTIGEGRFGE